MKTKNLLISLFLLILAAGMIFPVMAAPASDNATNYFNLAQIEINNGKYDRAVMYFDLALADNTTLISQGNTLMYLYKDKAAALADLGRYDDALTTVNAGLIQFRNSSGMWNNKGYILYKMGRYTDAADAYTQAVTIDPSYVKGWINKGNALSQAGRYQESYDAYNKALALDAENSDAKAGLAAAQKAAASALPVTTIALIVIVVLAAGVAVWYVKFRTPNAKDKKEKKNTK
jgi:tetratricopeptide (TPR) repeat protein